MNHREVKIRFTGDPSDGVRATGQVADGFDDAAQGAERAQAGFAGASREATAMAPAADRLTHSLMSMGAAYLSLEGAQRAGMEYLRQLENESRFVSNLGDFSMYAARAGTSAAEAMGLLVQKSAGMASQVTLITQANRALEGMTKSGISAEKSFKALGTAVEFAMIRSRQNPEQMAQTLERIMTGWVRGSYMLLDDYGLKLDDLSDRLGRTATNADIIEDSVRQMTEVIHRNSEEIRKNIHFWEKLGTAWDDAWVSDPGRYERHGPDPRPNYIQTARAKLDASMGSGQWEHLVFPHSPINKIMPMLGYTGPFDTKQFTGTLGTDMGVMAAIGKLIKHAEASARVTAQFDAMPGISAGAGPIFDPRTASAVNQKALREWSKSNAGHPYFASSYSDPGSMWDKAGLSYSPEAKARDTERARRESERVRRTEERERKANQRQETADRRSERLRAKRLEVSRAEILARDPGAVEAQGPRRRSFLGSFRGSYYQRGDQYVQQRGFTSTFREGMTPEMGAQMGIMLSGAIMAPIMGLASGLVNDVAGGVQSTAKSVFLDPFGWGGDTSDTERVLEAFNRLISEMETLSDTLGNQAYAAQFLGLGNTEVARLNAMSTLAGMGYASGIGGGMAMGSVYQALESGDTDYAVRLLKGFVNEDTLDSLAASMEPETFRALLDTASQLIAAVEGNTDALKAGQALQGDLWEHMFRSEFAGEYGGQRSDAGRWRVMQDYTGYAAEWDSYGPNTYSPTVAETEPAPTGDTVPIGDVPPLPFKISLHITNDGGEIASKVIEASRSGRIVVRVEGNKGRIVDV